MNYKSWFCLGAVAVSAAILTGCSSDSGKTPSASPSPSAAPATNAAPAPTAAAPAPAPTAASPTATTPTAGFGGQPVVADKTTTARAIETAAGLIPPTNGDNWAKTVAKGRPDPFAVLVAQPVAKIDPDAVAKERLERLKDSLAGKKSGGENNVTPSTSPLDTPAATKPSKTTKIAAAPIAPIKPAAIPAAKTTKATKVAKANGDKITVSKEPVAGKSSIDKPTAKTPTKKTTNDKTVALKPVPTPLSGGATGATTAPAAAAPKPEPTLARGIEVSGVIQAGGNTQVVVKLPKESFSRYVEVGDRVLDGKVLVKRIENSSSLVPVVVLEEIGIEVARKVGDVPSGAKKEEAK